MFPLDTSPHVQIADHRTFHRAVNLLLGGRSTGGPKGGPDLSLDRRCSIEIYVGRELRESKEIDEIVGGPKTCPYTEKQPYVKHVTIRTASSKSECTLLSHVSSLRKSPAEWRDKTITRSGGLCVMGPISLRLETAGIIHHSTSKASCRCEHRYCRAHARLRGGARLLVRPFQS